MSLEIESSSTNGSDNSNIIEKNNSIDYESYSMIKNVEIIALYCGATIFGTYVAETIKHDYYAKKFYEFIKNNEDNEDCDSYSDKDVNPETYKGRMTKPKSMDCIMSSKRFENFKKNLKNKGIFYDTTKNHNHCHQYKTKLSSIEIEESIKSIQYLSISLCNKNIKNEMLNFLKKNISNNIFKNIISETPEFKAIIDSAEKISTLFPEFKIKIYILKDDVEMSEGIKTICRYADFYSQCLIMDINSIYVLKKHQELFLSMKNKLYSNKYISPLDNFEIMENIYSQIIDDENISIPISSLQKNKESINFELGLYCGELCILCQEDIPDDCHSVKLKCCSAHYHFDCVKKNINKFIKNDKFCIMCNKRYKKNDIVEEWKQIMSYYSL
jgi:hypothetical protein